MKNFQENHLPIYNVQLFIKDTEGSKSLLVIIETYPHLVTVVLGILLACCLVGNIVQFITRNKKQVWEHGKGRVILY